MAYLQEPLQLNTDMLDRIFLSRFDSCPPVNDQCGFGNIIASNKSATIL